jgi:hypothetical protein
VPVPAALARDPAIAGPLGGLALSAVRPTAPMMALRAARWHADLLRLGLKLPFFLVHDVGLLYASPREQLALGPRVMAPAIATAAGNARFGDLLKAYANFLDELAAGEPSKRAQSLRLGDTLIVVLLARLLSAVGERSEARGGWVAAPLDLELYRDLEPQLASLFASRPRAPELQALSIVERARLHLLTSADAIDLDTLRLLGMLGPESGAASALAHVDLLAALGSPATNDIVNFSLELLPSVLETRRTHAAGTRATDGYAGVGTKGSIDSLVLSELAWDEDEFARRLVESELLFYTREQAREESRRLHYVLIDASASMRGDRQVFARGLAIALGKKVLLSGEELLFRFFDSRLYEHHRARSGNLPIAQLLGFRGERGRNPSRVFAQLATELALLKSREPRDIVVHLLTHAALHVPRALVADVKTSAHIFGVFILPSGGTLDLDYLDLLDNHAIVDHATLTKETARAQAAVEIVDSVGPRPSRLSLRPEA